MFLGGRGPLNFEKRLVKKKCPDISFEGDFLCKMFGIAPFPLFSASTENVLLNWIIEFDPKHIFMILLYPNIILVSYHQTPGVGSDMMVIVLHPWSPFYFLQLQLPTLLKMNCWWRPRWTFWARDCHSIPTWSTSLPPCLRQRMVRMTNFQDIQGK